MNNITFIKGQGGLGRPLPGQDYVSGLLFYTDDANLPSGWSTSQRVRLITSVQDAENNGILNDSNDATAATFTVGISNAGAVGDGFKLVYNGIKGATTILDYTVLTGQTTIDQQGAAIVALINATTFETKISCAYNTVTDTLTITLPKSEGLFPNSGTPVVKTEIGAFAGTLTQPSGGSPSYQDVWHYQISEFFRLNPKGTVYVGFYEVPSSTYDYSEVTLMQQFAEGKIRQIGVYVDDKAYAVGDVTILHNEIANNNDANKRPLSAIYAGDISAVSDLSTLSNLAALQAYKVSVVIAQDGAAKGNDLYKATGKSVCSLGACLGSVSFAAVSDDIAWVGKFNISNGVECDTPAFGNGELFKDKSVSFINTINGLRYIYLGKYTDYAGSYWNDSHTAIIQSNDYAYIENNRTIDKAIRGVYTSVLPALNSPLLLNPDGTLANTTIAYFESLAELNLFEMIRQSEISAQAVTIDPTQDVLSTNTLVISIQIVPIGVARAITVNIGFTTNI
jgi:hypothetical protein